MSAQQFKVAILLATYNGEKFLAQQMDSLLTQTFSDFTILVRDDGSTDETLTVIERYSQNFPEKFQVIKEHKQNVGPAQNFGLLLQHTMADYIFFCDQDDIWVKDKVALSLEKIRKLENNHTAVPCMVYSDMKSIDEHGVIMAESVWKELELNPRFFTLNRLLVQNIPHGCTMVINKAMQQLALPVPKEAILHDHWIALLAAACGKHAAIDTPLVLLRNHTHNVTRKQTSLPDKFNRYFSNLFSPESYEHFIQIRTQQAEALLQRTSTLSTEPQKRLLADFIRLFETSGIQRKQLMLKHKFFRTTLRHTLKLILRA